ncbi:MAG TPA: SRPBCC family protein [Candidatus Dormibacteraeota bacterium]|nr:SRPBCC family protein [Candidatus Dormibacteraeota bacterium]
MVERDSAMKVTLPSDQEIKMTRVFNAPRELVFEAYTKPEHVRNWWGPRSSTSVVFEAEVRPGGKWRYVILDRDGHEVPFTGVYQEVTPPERLVYTETYDVEPFNLGDPALNTATFTEEAGRTLVSVTTVYPSKEVRDYVLTTGMEGGAAESYDRLEELLIELSK